MSYGDGVAVVGFVIRLASSLSDASCVCHMMKVRAGTYIKSKGTEFDASL